MGFSLNDYEDFSKLTDESVAEDAILFGLRMNQGINLREIAERFQLTEQYIDNLVNFFEKLEKEGLAVQNQNWISLTQKGAHSHGCNCGRTPCRIREEYLKV